MLKGKNVKRNKRKRPWARTLVCLCLSLFLGLEQISISALAAGPAGDGGQAVTGEAGADAPAPAPADPEGETPAPAPADPEGETPAPTPADPDAVTPAPAPSVPDAVTPAPAPSVPDAVTPAPAPSVPDAVTPAPAPSVPDAVTPAPAPSVPDAVTPAPAPSVPDAVTPAPAPSVPDAVTPAPAPSVPDAITPAPAPSVPDAITPAPAPSVPDAITPDLAPAPLSMAPAALTEAVPAAVAAEHAGHTTGWTELTQTVIDSLTTGGVCLLESGQKYYLSDDLSTDLSTDKVFNVRGYVTLCLNGRTLTYTGSENAFITVTSRDYAGNPENMQSGFTLCDCQSSGSIQAENADHCVDVMDYSSFTMTGGSISAQKHAVYADAGENQSSLNPASQHAIVRISGGEVKGMDLRNCAKAKISGGTILNVGTGTGNDGAAINVAICDMVQDTTLGVDILSLVEIGDGVTVGDSGGSDDQTAICVSTAGKTLGRVRPRVKLVDAPTINGVIRLGGNDPLHFIGYKTDSVKAINGTALLNVQEYTGANGSLKIAPIDDTVNLAWILQNCTTEFSKFASGDAGYSIVSQVDSNVFLVKKHSHYECGKDSCSSGHLHLDSDGNITSIPHSDKVDFLAWPYCDTISGNGEEGKRNYFLFNDVEVSDRNSAGLYSGSPKLNGVKLCLNGHTITCKPSQEGSRYFLEITGAVSVCDCAADANKGSVTMSYTNADCSKFSVVESGDLSLYNCTVTGSGYGVRCTGSNAVVNIDGCSIQNNTNTGVSVTNGAGLNIQNSVISGNKGTGVSVEKGNGLNIQNSVISDNAGGVYTSVKTNIANTEITGSTTKGGIYISGNPEVTLDNVTITGNKRTGQGGGVYVASPSSNKLTLKNKVVITGNTDSNDQPNNLCLGGGTDSSTAKIGSFGELTAGSSIGVTCVNTTTPLTISVEQEGASTQAGYFEADDPEYKVAYEVNVLKIKDSNAHIHEIDGKKVAFDRIKELPDPSKLGSNETKYYVLDFQEDNPDKILELTEAWELTNGNNVTICLNGGTIKNSASFKLTKPISVKSGKLTLCDHTKETPGSITNSFKNDVGTAITVAGGELTIENIKITGWKTGLEVSAGTTVTMKDDAAITGCTTGVKSSGKVTMESGRMIGTDSRLSTGVSVERYGEFTMNGGQITGFETGVSDAAGGTFIMNEGRIGGSADGNNDSGAAGNTEYAIEASGEVQINGGEIKDNEGRAIYLYQNAKLAIKNAEIANNSGSDDAIGFHGTGSNAHYEVHIGDGARILAPLVVVTWEQDSNPTYSMSEDWIQIGPLTGETDITFSYSGETRFDNPYSTPEPFAKNASEEDTTDYSQYLNVKLVHEGKPYHVEYRDSGNGHFYYYFVEGEKAAGDGPAITAQPSAPAVPDGESPAGKDLTVEASGSGELSYQWKYNTTDSTEGGTAVPEASGGKTSTCKIPDLEPGDYWFFCEVTDGNGTTVTNTVKITIPEGSEDPGDKPIVIPEGGQPTAPEVPDGESPAGKDLTVEATSPGGKELFYQWKYNQTGGTDSGTNVPDANGGKTPVCKIPDLAPGTYYFYCVITDSDGKTVITNVVTIVIPEKKGEVLEPGGSVTTDDGKTEVKRDEDGGTVTIDKDKTDGTGPDTTITLPEDNKTGEVTVDKDTGDVTVPGGSTVKDGDGTDPGGKPDVTIGEQGGKVTPGGEVKIPEDGTANVGGATDGSGNTTGGTTITGGEGGTTVTPKDDGTVDVGEGGKVKTDPETPGGQGGTDVTLPNGGNVDPDGGAVTPGKDEDGKQIAGVDTNGDGNVDTIIVLPGTGGGAPGGDTITPNENGGVDVPAGTEIKAGGSGEDQGGGEGGASVTLPDGGEVTPGGVKPEGGKATTGEDKDGDGQPDIEVTLPDGGEIKGDGEGGLTVPGGTTVSTGEGENKTEIEIGGDTGGTDNGGTINKDGGVDLPEGGGASVDNGEGKPKTEITAGEGGGTVKPNPDGTTDVSGGSTIKTGEDGTEVTVGDNDGKGGTVDKDGGITLPGGGSAAITDEDGKKTTVTVPESGNGGEGGGTVKPGDGGSVEVPDGSKIKTETPGGGAQESTEITLPKGGEVSEGGSVKPGTDEDGKQIAGVDTDGDGKVDTIIVLPGKDSGNPDGDTLKPNDQGGVDVPKGTEVSSGSEGNQGGDKVVIGEQGGSLNPDGGVDLPNGGTATITDGGSTPQNPDKTITAGENGGTVKPNPDGSTDVSGQGTTVQVGGDGGDNKKPPVTVDDKGGTVTPEGDIEIKDGASVTVGGEDGKPGTTITAPEDRTDGEGGTVPGSTTVTPKDDGTVDVGEGGKVTTGGQNGEDGTPVTLPSGGNVNPGTGGTIKPNDNLIAAGEDKDGDGVPDTIIILPEGKGEITPDDKGGITLPGGSTIQSGGDDGGVSVTLPDGAELNPDGSVKPSGDGSLTVKGEEGQPDTTVKLPEGGAVSGDGQGGLVVPEGTEVKKDGENTPTVVVGGNGGSVGKDGNVNLPEGGSAVISDGRGSVEVKTPEGGQVNTADGSTTAPVVEINGITITAPEGETVKTDKGGTSTVVNGTTVSKGGVDVVIESGAPATVSKDGVITFPGGGTIQITKDGHTTTKTIAPGGSVNINNLGGNGGGSSSGGSGNSGSGGHSNGSSAGSINVSAGKADGGKVTISPTRPAAGQTVTIHVIPDNGYELDKLTVTDSNGKNVKLTKVSDSKYTFVMPDGKVTVTPSFVERKSGQNENGGQIFTDVPAGAWYAESVAYMADNGLMHGYSDGSFGPGNSTTRAHVVTILYRVEGEPAAGNSGFEDVSADRYYAKAVAWAAANGIVTGYSDTQFVPERNITREQMAAILYRYAQFKGLDTSAKADLSVFTDCGKVSSYAVPTMQWAVGSGIIQGRADGTLDPAGHATRAEVAVILTRFLRTIA